MSPSRAAVGAGDWLTAPCTPQVSSSAHCVAVSTAVNSHTHSPLTSVLFQSQHELKTCEGGSGSKVTEGLESPGGSDSAAAER